MSHTHQKELYATEQVRNVEQRQGITTREAARQSETGTGAAKYACYQVKLKGFSRACWAELIQPSGDALCYVPCDPVGGVDPPSCMFPPSMIIRPPCKSH